MSNNFFTVKKGLNVDPQSATTLSTMGDVQVDVSTGKMLYHNGTSSSAKVTEAHAATLTNKSIDASLNTISNLVDANIKSGAAIAYAKLALTGSVVNADISASAAIAYSKLNLSASITNADVATAAAIAYSKLNLVSSIVNADIASGAAIAYAKLALTASIVNADVASGAAIAYSKLNLSGSVTGADIATGAAIPYSKLALTNSVLNADIGAAAAIAYSKLNLVGSIVNADIATGAAIARAKIAAGTADAVLINDPSGNLSSETALSPVRGGTGVANNAAATLTRSGNFAKTETLTGVTSVTYPTTGTLATLAGTETLSNKTQGTALTFTQVATPSAPASGFNKLYPKSDGYFYNIDSSGAERKIGAGSGSINYVTNPDFEGDVSGYTAYSNTAQATPVTGTGGSPTVTITRTTTSPLRGVASGLITKTAVNSQGQGVSYAFTTDSADASKVLNITMDYAVDSGTYADGDLTAYIYDVTNAVVIQPVGYSILSASSGNKAKLNATFQTSSNSTSYRLCFHVASVSASAYALKIDNLSVGPVPVIQGAVITEWQAYTPSFTGFGTPTSVAFKSRRIGDSLEVLGSFVAGTTTAVIGLVGIGYNGGTGNVSVDPSKISSSVVIGEATTNTNAATFFGISPVAAGGVTSTVAFAILSSTSPNTVPSNASSYLNTGGTMTVHFTVPIVGWGAMASLGGADDARGVVMSAFHSAAQNFPSSTTTTIIGFDTANIDSHAGFNPSTGVYTVPTPGRYKVVGNILWFSNATGYRYMTVNQAGSISNAQYGGFVPAVNGDSTMTTAVAIFDCKAGDTIYMQGGHTSGISMGPRALGNGTSLLIEKLGGSATIQAAESVSCKYTQAVGQSIANGSVQIIKFDTKEKDTHGFYSTSSGQAIVPVAGDYGMAAMITLGAQTFSASNKVTIYVYKNNSQKYTIAREYFLTTGTQEANVFGYVEVPGCVAGDVLDFRIDHGESTARTLIGISGYVHMSIRKVGN